MNRKEFGQLIEVLRHQTAYTRQNNKPFTQKEMADHLNISLRNYGRIERGEVVNIEAETLEGLAGLLGLTTRERYPFFLAASGVSRYAVPSDSDQVNHLKENLYDRVSRSIFPTYVFDVYGNIILTKPAMLSVLGFGETDFLNLQYRNLIWAAIHLDRSHAYSQEDSLLFGIWSLSQIRYTSLRYRATPFGRTLFEEMSKHQSVRAAWQIISNQKGMDFADGRPFEQDHRSLGQKLKYNIFLSRIITEWGDLYVQTFSPLDRPTSDCFMLLNQDDRMIEPYPNWPQLS